MLRCSLFHTVLFHRLFGKYTYTDEGNYYIGTVGYKDVDCDYIDHTYIRADSSLLDQVRLFSVSTNNIFAENLTFKY